MGGMTPLLSASGLAIGHGRRVLAAGIGLELGAGEILCLLGPNGTGKTTLFRTLLGLLPPLAGRIALGGQSLATLGRAGIARRLAHVPQQLATPFAYSALDIVLMGAASRLGAFARPGAAETRRAMAALDELGIAALAPAPVTELSGGQRQLVLVARALAQEAGAILMDEPTASLDFANRHRVDAAIRLLAARGTGVLLSTHDPDQAARLADRALLMGAGGLIASGPAHQVMSARALEELYGAPVRREILADGSLHFRHP